MNGIGDRLSELRKDHGYTQEFISIYLNVTESSVSSYERDVNCPSLENLIKLADLYNVSLDYLALRTKEKTNLHLESKDHREFIIKFYELLNKFNIQKK